MTWWLWILLGVLALAGEAASMALFLIYVGVAAFAAGILALIGLGAAAQVAAFVALSLLLLGLVRPRMLHALVGRIPQRTLTNQGRMVDRLAEVTQPVTEHSGMIRVGNAEFWTARLSPPATRPIEAGQSVRIVYIDGVTAYVSPVVAPAEARQSMQEEQLVHEER